MEATYPIFLKVSRIRFLKSIIKNTESEIGPLVNDVKDFLGDDTSLTKDGIGICSYEHVKPARRFDADAFAKDYPELYERYLKDAKPSRRFVVL